MGTNPPPQPAPGYQQFTPPAQKSNVLKIILIIVGACFLLMLLGMIGVGYFVYKIKQNPGAAIAKLALAANPDVDVVSTDAGNQQITIRDKKTGKVVTMSWEDAKNGKLTFKEDGKDALTISSNGPNGIVEMKSKDGSVQIGGDLKIPSWVPSYPASEPKATFSAQGKDGASGTFAFTTNDPPDKVTKFYQDELQTSGLKLTTNISTQDAGKAGGVLVAEDQGSKHTITLAIGQDSGHTSVSVTYASK